MARLTLALLGPVRIALDGNPITTFESDKGRALLAYLAVEADRPHRRESLVGLLWPNSTDAAARRNLRQTLFSMRQAIGDAGADPPFLLITRESIQFNSHSDHTLDTGTFSALLAACDRHEHARIETCGPCAERLQQAAALYRGRFLQDFSLADSEAFDEWTTVEREALHRRALEALTHLADYYEQRGKYDEAQRYAARQLELDPWREEAHRQLMRVLAMTGQRSAALAQYEICRRVLNAELGTEPSSETRALVEQIRRGELGAPRETPAAAPRLTFPAALTPFVGRERELAALARLLADPACRLLTLTGPGGVGKTRLALQAAWQGREAFAQGVAFVALAQVGTQELVVSAVASALGLTFYGPAEPKAQLLNALRQQQILLVLDGVEHLLYGAEVLNEILLQAPDVKLLVTSREPLDLHDEWAFVVDGLSVRTDNPAEEPDALALFLQRARRAQVGFELSDAERAAVVRICELVEGMPLAIELAAAWVRMLSCAEIALEIERNVDFLAASARDVPERHRSIRAVFDQSWRLLSAEEQQALRGLSVFRGGFTREAAEHVTGATLAILSSLVTKSLLRRTEAGRYDLHELVRQYAQAELVSAGDEQNIRQRHAQFFLALAEVAEPSLRGAQQRIWLDRLEIEHDNLRAVMQWSLDSGTAEIGLKLVGSLLSFWWTRGYHHEWRERSLQLLARPEAAGRTSVRAKALNATAYVLSALGNTDQAQPLLDEALAIGRELDDRWNVAWSLRNLGLLAISRGDYDAARSSLEPSLAISRELRDKPVIGWTLYLLGDVALYQGDYERARVAYAESIAVLRELKERNALAYSLRRLGRVALRQGQPAQAAELCRESLALNLEVGDRRAVAACLAGLAGVAQAQAQPLRALRLCGAVSALLDSIATPLMPADQRDYESNVAALRAEISAADLADVWADGRAMTMEQAVAYALQDGAA